MSESITSGVASGEANLDPYFVASADNPAASIAPVLFNGSNFMQWRREIQRALGAKNKMGFIDGSIKKPNESAADSPKWKRAGYLVSSWIVNSMKGEIGDDFDYAETAFDLWKDVKERFGQTNGLLIFQLRKEIANLKQANLSILSYYGKIKRLWEDMATVKCAPTCTCGALAKCTCELLNHV